MSTPLIRALAVLGALAVAAVLWRCGAPDPLQVMVRDQIEAPQDGRIPVTDSAVLAAMRRVPRHEFVPEHFQAYAYEDRALPIEEDQTISQPYIVAFMTAALGLQGDETVLEVGTGSGYQAAVLAEIVDQVYTIEIVESLATQAKERLHDMGYRNIEVRAGDGYRGWPEHAQFDAIIVTAAPNHMPPPLFEQLRVGGRLILPEGGDRDQELVLITKLPDGSPDRKQLQPVEFVPMTGEAIRRRR